MNEKTVVSPPDEDRRQQVVAMSHALKQLLRDATAFGGLQYVPLELESNLDHGLNGHLMSSVPVLQALMNKLVGHPELWTRNARRENLDKTVLLTEGIASVLGPEAADAAGFKPSPPHTGLEAEIIHDRKLVYLTPEWAAQFRPWSARDPRGNMGKAAPRASGHTNAVARVEPYFIGALGAAVLILSVIAIVGW